MHAVFLLKYGMKNSKPKYPQEISILKCLPKNFKMGLEYLVKSKSKEVKNRKAERAGQKVTGTDLKELPVI